jgi:hypothetical protein
MFGLWKSAPKLEAAFTPTLAVARELAREVEVNGELVVRNVDKDAEMHDLQVVLVAGGTRRIDLPLSAAFAGTRKLAAGAALRATVAWKIPLAAPMRAPAAEVQLITTTGGKHTPLALSNRFPLANE